MVCQQSRRETLQIQLTPVSRHNKEKHFYAPAAVSLQRFGLGINMPKNKPILPVSSGTSRSSHLGQPENPTAGSRQPPAAALGAGRDAGAGAAGNAQPPWQVPASPFCEGGRCGAEGGKWGPLPELDVAVSSPLPHLSPGLPCFAGRRRRREGPEQPPSERQRCRLLLCCPH